MSDQGRAAYEAMIEAMKTYGAFGSVGGCAAIMGNRIRAWQDAGEWRPTEQHETVTAILVEIDEHLADDSLDSDLDKVVAPWLEAGKPGFPQPVDPYGAEITGDFGGRCPVSPGEIIQVPHMSGTSWISIIAEAAPWNGTRTFRRIQADHPGDSYWHGVRETIPESGKAGLDVMDRVVILGGRVGRAHEMAARPGSPFRRWLKGDA